jgi:hypothetical protein
MGLVKPRRKSKRTDAAGHRVIDPVYSLTISAAAGLVLVQGAWQKWQQHEAFAAAMQDYELIPDVAVPSASRALIATEATIGLALLWPRSHPWALLAGIALLVMVTAAVVLNLLRGRTAISCGCGGASDQQISWSLVMRNGLFATLLGLAAQPWSDRQLIPLDYLTCLIGALMLAGFYAVVGQLLSNQPRLDALRYR